MAAPRRTKDAQSRRKAQNRAAQHTFRERKEQHVHELDARISKLESKCRTLRLDNQCLQLALHCVCKDNEILRAAFPKSPKLPWLISNRYTSRPDEFSQKDYNAKSLADASVDKEYDGNLSRASANSRDMSAAQPWSLIQGHPLVQQGQILTANICKHLKEDDTPDDQRQAIENLIIWAALECLRRTELGAPFLLH
ncbi:hypothetical protein IQ07DRAFT_646373 [Pyrenochaeta sp. DS3sAY3a]|nr:hypothetical protein IQ07DRAFT_646373 [Pyrenochaeta sp. DS3sAY3a]